MKLLRTIFQHFLSGKPQAGWLFPDKLPDDPEARRIVAGTMFWAYLIPTILATLFAIFGTIFLVYFLYQAFTRHTDEEPRSIEAAELARVGRINYEYHRTHPTDWAHQWFMSEAEKKDAAAFEQQQLARDLEGIKEEEALAAKEAAEAKAAATSGTPKS